MNAVWLSDDLMVSPSAVVGLIARSGDDGYGATVSVSRWINVVLISGHEEQVWSVSIEVPIEDGGEALKERVSRKRALQKTAVEAEMARLSELLWPTPEPIQVRNGMSEWSGRLRQTYDPELYGLARCATASDDGQCNLAEGHPGDHRWGLTFSEAHPGVVPDAGRSCGSMSNAGYRCVRYYGHHLHSPHMDDAGRVWTHSDHI